MEMPVIGKARVDFNVLSKAHLRLSTLYLTMDIWLCSRRGAWRRINLSRLALLLIDSSFTEWTNCVLWLFSPVSTAQ